MKRLYYRTEQFEKVSACGMECEFNDMRIDRSTVPKRNKACKFRIPVLLFIR